MHEDSNALVRFGALEEVFMSYRPHGAWRTMEVLEEPRWQIGSRLTSRSLVLSLDTSIGTSGCYDLPCGCRETHLFQVESPTLWSSMVPCTFVALYICTFILEEWC
jgi:hypothetical protein